MVKLPRYKSILSNRWSFSFLPPDPGFPPQKVGFIYDTATMQLTEQRAMFTGLYDSVRNGFASKLPGYPGGMPSNFWSSGRLPFMATFTAVVNGASRQVRIVNIHAKSSSDALSYNRRVYDVKVLKDTLDAYCSNDIVLLVGDYNDRLSGTSYAGASISPYKIFVDDGTNYQPLTLPLDVAGRISYLSGTGLIDHIIASNELQGLYIPNGTDIEDPRAYVPNYNANSGSDHLPVFSRFMSPGVLPVTYTYFNGVPVGGKVDLTWATLNETNNDHFTIERSADGQNFAGIGMVKAINRGLSSYKAMDSLPLPGNNYYRLKQTDRDGKFTYSTVVVVNVGLFAKNRLTIYPNPVKDYVQLSLTDAGIFSARLTDETGRVVLVTKGNTKQITTIINENVSKMGSGLHVLMLSNGTKQYIVTFIKVK